jgi:hypothetical protein
MQTVGITATNAAKSIGSLPHDRPLGPTLAQSEGVAEPNCIKWTDVFANQRRRDSLPIAPLQRAATRTQSIIHCARRSLRTPFRVRALQAGRGGDHHDARPAARSAHTIDEGVGLSFGKTLTGDDGGQNRSIGIALLFRSRALPVRSPEPDFGFPPEIF